jgi:lysophospholipase L1-like esterase
MRDAARAAAADLVVMFLPFKSQIYLPLVDRAVDAREVSRAIRFYLPDNPAPPNAAAMLANRFAQNRLMQRFCAAEGIAFLDTTPALDARVRTGENVYFPDESHFNETGHRVVVDALAAFLDSAVRNPQSALR